MRKRRRKLTDAELQELLEARDWCRERGWAGTEYYEELLRWLDYERRLPGQEPLPQEEERP